jgi:hypothetical protein
MTKEIKNIDLFPEAVNDKKIVKGFTHDFYNGGLQWNYHFNHNADSCAQA